MLLDRLRDRRAVAVDAVVDSSCTRRLGIPEQDTKLITSPVRLAELGTVENLRGELTSARGLIGHSAGASKPGNSSNVSGCSWRFPVTVPRTRNGSRPTWPHLRPT